MTFRERLKEDLGVLFTELEMKTILSAFDTYLEGIAVEVREIETIMRGEYRKGLIDGLERAAQLIRAHKSTNTTDV